MKYKSVILGGTFDHLHKGHEAMLTRAFECGKHVWIGVTSALFLSSIDPKTAKFPGSIEPFEMRLEGVKKFLWKRGWFGRATMLTIDDKFGTTLTDESLEAIVVSPETELVATEINLLRAQNNWPALEAEVVPWVLASDGTPIHSVRIRAGEIDRAGNVFELPSNWGMRNLPKNLRPILQKPMGTLFIDASKNHEEAVNQFVVKILRVRSLTQLIINSPFPSLSKREGIPPLYERGGQEGFLLISVGDAVTDALLKIGVTPDISIVDLYIQRKQVYKNIQEIGFRNIKVIKRVKNPAGTLSFDGFSVLSSLIHSEAKPAVLQVDGEEDLFTLLAMFSAPLGSLIVYGQPARHLLGQKASAGGPHEGVVVIEVTEKKKEEAREYLEQFEK